MAMTVHDVIRLPEVQRGEPEIVSSCRWNEPIRWVHVGDVADLSNLLQGGELVLTTGASLVRSPSTYLNGLSRAGAIGVIVELDGSGPPLPSAAAALAEEADLALVVLHREIRFVRVTEAVHRHIVAEQFDAVAFDRLVHETFTELSMKRATVHAILEAASTMLDEPIVLEDLSHQVLATATAGLPVAALLDEWEPRSRRSLRASHDAETWATVVVGPYGESWGRLIIPRPPVHRERATMVLERAAVALALDRMFERDRAGLQRKAQSSLIDDVLERRLTDETEVAARAHALGLQKSAEYYPFAVLVRAHPGEDDPVATQRRIDRYLDAVSHAVRAGGHSGLFIVRRSGEVCGLMAVKPAQAAMPEQALSVMAVTVRKAIQRIDPAGAAVVAVGEPDAAITHAVQRLRDASHVADAAAMMGADDRPYHRASDVRLRGLVALLRHDPRMQSFAETELRGLTMDAHADAADRLDLLRSYLRSGGNKAALASELHISRPALYKRIATLESALGVDLSDTESVLSLYVAVLIHDARARTHEK
ncbi:MULTISPECIES: PucR family transcriptional regulator [Dietzia]|uniref:PucR family transcriptional regulator n=1 Tax=Dietzia TaxID=37914 RepID=UPI000784E06B|nr:MULTISPECIES: PucR family transcriptional regulator [Dietzia]MCT2060098.1 PucR family transcriptional regulator [Dietzia cinnamea]MCT2122546.1 PucR family transcriptional regulator [Dietzia cinnamea]MCT2146700.1 PucR family transcriptional regulator [Dietzia cinnamea]MCT2305941.1 PucR family transcriptional regulator [Dietzia cinnamea]